MTEVRDRKRRASSGVGGLLDERLLGRQRLERKEVDSRNPRRRQMRGGRHQVGRKRRALPFDSMSTIWWCIVWPPVRFTFTPGMIVPIVVHQFEDARRISGRKSSGR